MRYVLAILLSALFVLPASAQENDGEKFFRQIEKKMKSAEAIEAASSISIDGQGKGQVLNASLLLTKDNKARLLLNGTEGGMALNIELVSDGKQMRTSLPFDTQTQDREVPKQFHHTMSGAVCRVGLLAAMLLEKGKGGPAVETDLEKLLPLSDFKLEEAEKLAGKETKVVSYTILIVDGNQEPARITLWVDAKTLAPVRRLIVPDKGPERITETYHQFTYNPKKIDFNFALPPKKVNPPFNPDLPPDAPPLPPEMKKIVLDPALEATVSGKVTYQGKPITGAYIDFYPAVGDLRGEETDTNGRYAVKGLQEGECKVVVNSSRVPASFRDRYTTTLTITLKKGANVFDIQLK